MHNARCAAKLGEKEEIVIFYFYTEILTGKLFCGVFLQVKRVKKVTKIQHLLFHRIWKKIQNYIMENLSVIY